MYPEAMPADITLSSLWLEDLTWADVRDALAAGYTTAIVAAGATEQHGPHLPLSVDALVGRALAERVARLLGNALIAPVITVGFSPYHMHLAGTISLSRETLSALVGDYCRSLAHHGFRTIVLISSHGGNNGTLGRAAAALRDDLPGVRLLPFVDGSAYGRVQRATAARFGVEPRVAGVHSGEAETSQILAVRPDLVRLDRAEPGFTGRLQAVAEQLKRDPLSVSPSGVLGDPTPARAEHGDAYLDDLAGYIANWVAEQLAAVTVESTP